MSNVTLTDFLLARIAEDEKAARDRSRTAVMPDGNLTERGLTSRSRRTWQIYSEVDNEWRASDARDVARVLAECEAKRRIIEMHPQTRQYGECHTLSEAEPRIVDLGLDLPAELLVLASVYADHPDYRQEWRL